MKRVVSVWLPSFATDRLMGSRRPGQRTHASTPDQRERTPQPPCATTAAVRGGIRLVAVNRTALAAGVRPGLSLAEARALLPGLAVAEAAPAADAEALDRLARWCGRYSPWTAVDTGTLATALNTGPAGANPLDAGGWRGELGGGAGLWLDVSGCAHLFGGEQALLDDLTGRLRGLGMAAVAAVADTAGAAWAAARFIPHEESCNSGAGATAIVIPADGLAAALAPLPVAALRLPPAMIDSLILVGLRRIADVEALPRGPLAARFGGLLLRRLDQALGRAEEPLSPRRSVPAMLARLVFADPIGHRDDIAAAARHLIADLCVRLEAAYLGARRLELTLYRTDGTVAGAAIGTSRPSRDPSHLQRLFREKLEALDAGFGVEVATVAAVVAEPLAPAQMALNADGGIEAEAIGRLIDRLGNRLGPGNVSRFAQRASHVPERACRETPAARGAARGTMPGAAHGASKGPAKGSKPSGAGGGRSRQPRPLTLLPWPEPIEVIAPVPDGPPVLIRRGGRHHKVVAAEGPERIAPEWWLQDGGHDPECQSRVRDYYRVEDEQGHRLWIYREGLYRPDVPPRWYLHGLFA